jgi:AraC-like DNA-binding protein
MYLLGRLMVTNTAFHSQDFIRDRRLMATTDNDHFLIQYFTKGYNDVTNGDRQFRLDSGHIGVVDLGKEVTGNAVSSEVISIVIPRDVLGYYMADLDSMNGLTIATSTPRGRILRDHMISLLESLPEVQLEEGEAISAGVAGLIAGLLRPECVTNRQASNCTEQAGLAAMLRYIDDNLHSESLGVEELCRNFGYSRPNLYRLFKPLGGIAHHIKMQRLKRCFRELSSPRGQRMRIIDVASAWGFYNSSHFSRLFRQVYGISPSEAQSMGGELNTVALGSGNRGGYVDEVERIQRWLNGL